MAHFQGFTQSKETKKREIIGASVQFSANYIKGDFRAMAETYTNDALLFPPGKDVIIGKENILKYWENLPKTTILMHKSVSEKLVFKGKEVHDYGYYFVQSQKENEAPNPVYSAKYYIIWITENGEWKMKLDMWNGRNPDWNKQ
jgi:ketosteroid isomerase-like protein